MKQFGFQVFCLGGGRKRPVADGIEVDDDVSWFESVSLLNEGFKFISLHSVWTESCLFVDHFRGEDYSGDGVLYG